MTNLKNVTRISYKRDPEKGERGAISRVRDWSTGVQYLAGAAGETYADFVYYSGVYYRCMQSHISSSSSTPYALVQANAGIWVVETNFQMVATKVAFIGEGGTGWIIDGGVVSHSSGKIALNADGSITTSNGKFSVDADGHIIATDADITGTINAKSGTFGGFVKTLFSSYTEACSYNSTTGEYILNGKYNIDVTSVFMSSPTLRLPNDSSYAGTVLNIWDSPIKTRSSGDFTLKTNGGIYHPDSLNTTYGSGYLPVKQLYCSGGGFIQLICLPNGCWQVVSNSLVNVTLTP